MFKKILTACFTLLIVIAAFSQDSSNEKSYFKLEASYLNNYVYNGRKDSLPFPYLTTTFTYYHKSGFNVGSSISYVTNESYFDLITIDAGYDFTISKQFSGSVYASKYFYSANSNSVKGASTGNLGGTITFESNIISSSLDVGVLFSEKSDIYIIPNIYHEFSFGKENNQFTISPTITANLGTLNYYKAYLNKPKRNLPPPQRIQVQNAKGLLLLDYEFSVPITYDAKKWGLFFTPTYAIPKSPLQITRPNGAVFYTEALDNSFYFEVGANIKF